MATCAAICAPKIPPSSFGNCTAKVRRGGISRVLFATCDIDETTLAGGVDSNNKVVDAVWRPLFQSCKLRLSPIIAEGGKDAPSVTSVRLSACSPEAPSLMTHTYTLIQRARTTYNQDAEFWNEIMRNQLQLQVAFIHCSGEVSPFMRFAITVGEVTGNTFADNASINATITVESSPMFFVNNYIPGLFELGSKYTSYYCVSGGYASDTNPTILVEDLCLVN